MSPRDNNYKESVQLSREQEETYHRREYEQAPRASQPSYTTESYQVVSQPTQSKRKEDKHNKALIARYSDDSDNDNFDEWTTSKKKVNHKTRQVETRVSRQLLVEDGKVIADSGPQVTTRIKEDNREEECEKEKAPKNRSKFEALENAPEGCDTSGRVLGEKKEIQRVTHEVREENMQYHDERFKELTGRDVHQRAIKAPHELITIHDSKHSAQSMPRGKMVHYSNKGKKYQDTDEILEVAKLAIDGSITKEVKRTRHHEECSDNELPDETGEVEALRNAPTVTRSSRRHVDYVNDFDDTDTPSVASDDEIHEEKERLTPKAVRHHDGGSTRRSGSRKEEPFPRYQIDPLLNTLKDDDFRPASSGRRHKEHRLEQKDNTTSSEERERPKSPAGSSTRRYASPSPARMVTTTASAVEIPEEYRANRQRLLQSKRAGQSLARERNLSPPPRSRSSQLSSPSRLHRSHRGDASVQAHLTDEEAELKSLKSSSSTSGNSHRKTTKQLQRQSTANSSRNYYFGDNRKRASSVHSVSSSSSSSLSDPKENLRKQGARSRDSGFKSPHYMRTPTPIKQQHQADDQQQIYSVSSKSKKRDRDVVAASPTPTSASLGQRSVKTTTTTLTAGLADRPLSRNSERSRSATNTRQKTSSLPPSKANKKDQKADGGKVSKPPSPFQKLSKLFAPSSPKRKTTTTTS